MHLFVLYAHHVGDNNIMNVAVVDDGGDDDGDIDKDIKYAYKSIY